MLAKSLEKILNDLFQKTRSEGAEFVGVEHLLQALLSDSRCRDLLAASGAKIEDVEKDLADHIASQVSSTAAGPHDQVHPTLAFQRTLQRAVFHIQASERGEVGTIDVLVSLFSERESGAVGILAKHGIGREDLVRQLGDFRWNDAPANVLAVHSVSGGVFTGRTSQADIATRLDALEAKLDTAIAEIRELAAKLTQGIERRPPED